MKTVFLIVFIFSSAFVFAQDDLLSELESELPNETVYTIATFKGTRLVNGHTVRTRKKNELEFIISHRFERLNLGAYELFGLDYSYVRIGLDYGITDRFNVGIGRSSVDKSYDIFGKYMLLRQVQEGKGSPVTATLMISTAARTSNPAPKDDPDYLFSDRVSYGYTMLIARKFNEKLSLQLMPSLVHRNRVTAPDVSNVSAIGMGMRWSITKSVTINGEYYLRLNQDIPGLYDPIAIGVDIETGGHVFQFHLTNSTGMFDRAFITETTGDFFGGDIHLGFNISRTFQLKH